MKTGPPPLLPILRSHAQGRLLTTLFMDPDREFTISQLADRSGTSVPTATREVDRGIEAGILRGRRVGRNKLVRADEDGPFFEPLAQLLLRAFGPLPLLAVALSGIANVEHVYVFGSWAARHVGKRGPAPRDIDVLVIGDPNRDDVYEAANSVERQLDRPVQVTIRTPAQWEAATDDSFLREVRRRPLVEVPLAAESP